MAITESFNVSRLMDYECTTECPDFVFSEKDCVNDILSKDPQSLDWYNAIVGFRLIGALLSFIGSLSIIVSVIRYKRMKSYEVLPIFILSIADFLLCVCFMLGASYWFNSDRFSGSHSLITLCLSTALLTTLLVLVTTNLTVMYALSICVKISLELSEWRYTKVTAKIGLLVAYSLSWIVPVIVIVPLFFNEKSIIVWRCSSRCSCGCEPLYLNTFIHTFYNNSSGHGYNYESARIRLLRSVAITYTVNYTLDIILLGVLYTIVICLICCRRKNPLQVLGEEMLLPDGQNKRMRFWMASRILAYFLIFIICGVINFVVSCIILARLSSNQRDPPSPGLKHGILLSQALTLPLQGFLNALVYGWTSRKFRSYMFKDQELLLSTASNDFNEPSLQGQRRRTFSPPKGRYTSTT